MAHEPFKSMTAGLVLRWGLILRAYAFPVVAVPLLVGAVLAFKSCRQANGLWIPLLLGALLCLHGGINLVNDYYDDRRGVDRADNAPTSWSLTRKLLTPPQARSIALSLMLLSLLLALPVLVARGFGLTGLALAGMAGSYFYSAPPLSLKYRGLGEAVVFLLAGPGLTAAVAKALTGEFSTAGWLCGVPLGFLASAILYGNNLRDRDRDAAAGFRTLAHRLGAKAPLGYPALVIAAWLSLGLMVIHKTLSPLWAIPPVLASLLLLVSPVRATVRAARPGPRDASASLLRDIDMRTARAHAVFGVLLALGLWHS